MSGFAFVLVGVSILVLDSVAIVLAFVLVLIGWGFVVAWLVGFWVIGFMGWLCLVAYGCCGCGSDLWRFDCVYCLVFIIVVICVVS